jgi:hypothetical protein
MFYIEYSLINYSKTTDNGYARLKLQIGQYYWTTSFMAF